MSQPALALPPAAPKKVTVATLASYKARGRRAVFVTAYDYPTAVFAERAGVDMLLVGDSAAMTVLGCPNTLGVSMNEMLVFARAVCRGAKTAFVVGDLPFLSYQVSDEEAVRNASVFSLSAGKFIAFERGELARRLERWWRILDLRSSLSRSLNLIYARGIGI